MATTQVAKVATIYDNSPAEVQVLVDALFGMWGASDQAEILLKKAQRLLPKEQKQASDMGSELSEIWKNCREAGIAPDVAKVQKLYTEQKALRDTVKKAQTEKKCAAKDRRVYREAAGVYEEDCRGLAETIRGKPIKAVSKLDPSVLARIAEKRKASRSNQ